MLRACLRVYVSTTVKCNVVSCSWSGSSPKYIFLHICTSIRLSLCKRSSYDFLCVSERRRMLLVVFLFVQTHSIRLRRFALHLCRCDIRCVRLLCVLLSFIVHALVYCSRVFLSLFARVQDDYILFHTIFHAIQCIFVYFVSIFRSLSRFFFFVDDDASVGSRLLQTAQRQIFRMEKKNTHHRCFPRRCGNLSRFILSYYYLRSGFGIFYSTLNSNAHTRACIANSVTAEEWVPKLSRGAFRVGFV